MQLKPIKLREVVLIINFHKNELILCYFSNYLNIKILLKFGFVNLEFKLFNFTNRENTVMIETLVD